jgi:hypothetical protein
MISTAILNKVWNVRRGLEVGGKFSAVTLQPSAEGGREPTPGPGNAVSCPDCGWGPGVEMIFEFTEFERPHRLASFTRLGPMDIGSSLTFESTAYGMRMA